MSNLPASMFAPLELAAEQLAVAEEQPSLWRRLWASGRARFAMALVVFLLGFALIGPLLWTQQPDRQWLSHTSLGPSLGYQAKLVDTTGYWRPGGVAESLQIVEANTERVRLHWPALQDAVFAVYRSEDLSPGVTGVPLGSTATPWFEDRLQLRARQYRYTVVASRQGDELQRWELSQTVAPAISVFEAQLHGLLAVDAVPPPYIEVPAHPLGTDALGRDMLARLIYGARTSLFVGVTAPLVFILLGTLYGALSGLSGHRLDNGLMRFADFVIALPFLLFMILFRVGFGIGPGESGVLPMLLAMVLLGWPGSARLVRGQVLKLREDAYVQAARIAGAGKLYLICRHLLPNVMPVILVSLSFAIPIAIFLEAFLSFIGMGVAPPTPSWGSLCNDGLKNLLVHPHELMFPAAFISVAVLAFNLLGDSLRDAMDVRLQAESL